MKLIFEKLDLIYLHAEPAQNGVQVVFNFSFTNRSKNSIFTFPPNGPILVYEKHTVPQTGGSPVQPGHIWDTNSEPIIEIQRKK